MLPSFALLHTESVNYDRDSVCHIILVPVIEGPVKAPVKYSVNLETYFEFILSGLSRQMIEDSPSLAEV